MPVFQFSSVLAGNLTAMRRLLILIELLVTILMVSSQGSSQGCSQATLAAAATTYAACVPVFTTCSSKCSPFFSDTIYHGCLYVPADANAICSLVAQMKAAGCEAMGCMIGSYNYTAILPMTLIGSYAGSSPIHPQYSQNQGQLKQVSATVNGG